MNPILALWYLVPRSAFRGYVSHLSSVLSDGKFVCSKIEFLMDLSALAGFSKLGRRDLISFISEKKKS